ncbi:MAG: DUF4262 domain-containing protein [Bacteroidia bacterium]|nr:DUF4262 domain-containing protein [Bacteroidia bacterium]
MKEKLHDCRDAEHTSANIEKHGLSVIIIEATDYLPAFAYSIGLWKTYNHPEIIVFGLTTKTLHTLVNDAAELIKAGNTIETYRDYDEFFEKGNVQFIPVHESNKSDYFGAGINFYNSEEFAAMQFVWTDRNNKFPWEDNYEKEFKYRQPLLDRNFDFKFREEKNLAVFTTKQHLELNSPIVRVTHDEDGDWQFLTSDYTEEDARVVGLEEMIKRDKTLNEVFDLDYGESAERESNGRPWVRTKENNGE